MSGDASPLLVPRLAALVLCAHLPFLACLTWLDHASPTKVGLRQAIFVSVAGDHGASLCPIEDHQGNPAKAEMREDAVTIGVSTRGLAYRPEYRERMHHERGAGAPPQGERLALDSVLGRVLLLGHRFRSLLRG
jgi:hypothetical protein